MKNIIKSFITVFKPETHVMLGRWQIIRSETTVANVVKLANEDHCGTCVPSKKDKSLIKYMPTSNEINR